MAGATGLAAPNYSWDPGVNSLGGSYDPFAAYNTAKYTEALTTEQRAKLYEMASAGTSQVRNPYDYVIGPDPSYVHDMAAQQQQIGQDAQQGYAALQTQAGQAQQQGAMLQGLGGYASDYGQQAAKGMNAGAAAISKSSAGMLSQGGSVDQRQGYQLDFGQQAGLLGGSLGYADQLGSMQQGPSGAQAMLQSGANQSMAQSLALARSGRGFGGSAAGQAQALSQNAQTMQQVGNQAALLRAQEDAQWRAQQAQNLTQAAGIYQGAGAQFGQQQALAAQNFQANQAQNDQFASQLYGLGLQGQQAAINAQGQAAQTGLAGISQGANIYGQGSTLQQQGINQQGTMLGAGAQAASQGNLNAFGFNQAQNATDMSRENMISQDYATRKGISIAQQQVDNQKTGSYIGAIGTGLGIAAMASDERVKKNIVPVGDFGSTLSALDEQADPYGINQGVLQRRSLDTENPYGYGQAPPRILDRQNPYTDLRPAQAYSYEYTDPEKFGQGRFVGPMAQDLEKSPATESAVFTDTDGVKKIDTSRLALVNTSAISEQQRRIDELEKMLAAQSRSRAGVTSDKRAKKNVKRYRAPASEPEKEPVNTKGYGFSNLEPGRLDRLLARWAENGGMR